MGPWAQVQQAVVVGAQLLTQRADPPPGMCGQCGQPCVVSVHCEISHPSHK